MSLRSRRRRSLAGFTVMEAIVSIMILVIVMAGALSLMFGMRSFATRQQSFTFPRQTARSAIDYLSFYAEGAGDLNTVRNNPNALVMYYIADAKTGTPERQASYNNVTDASFADLGTDILTMAIPDRPVVAPIVDWTGHQHSADLHVKYTAGCPDNMTNVAMFEIATNASPAASVGPPAVVDTHAQSGLLMLADDNGAWCYFQITDYKAQDADCTGSKGWNIHLIANSGQSGQIDPPSGHPELLHPKIMCGVGFRSFRVHTDAATGVPNLEQKSGMFDPTVDNPYPVDPAAPRFNPIVENVEDLQIAYVYGLGAQSGVIWNNSTQDASGNWKPHTLATPAVPADINGIPTQGGWPIADPQWDITNVIGLRVSVTARSLPLPLASLKLSTFKAKTPGWNSSVSHHFRPASEDNPEGTLDFDPAAKPQAPVYDHNRLTTTLMLRNRMLGS